MKYIIPILALTFSCANQPQPTENTSDSSPKEETKRPPNIILMVGDGMGLSQLSSAFYYGAEEPNFTRFKRIAFSRTSSSSHKITDSAAGATAFSCGIKTYNGAIGVNSDSTAAETIVEALSREGWNTGLVSTSSITHATPGSFYGHVESRAMQDEIAAQLIHSDVDFFAGGGINFFTNRLDELNILDSLIAAGFAMDTTSIDTPIPAEANKAGYLLAPDGMIAKHEGRDDVLIKAAQKAIDFLSQKEEPFFLMIEGSQIDWGGHANIAEYVIEETLDFDKTIGKVLDLAEADGNTLVIVTADHETGGFTLAGEKKEMPYRRIYDDYNSIVPTFSTGGHSAALIPVLAYGPGSENVEGIFQNTNIHSIMMDQAHGK